MKVAFFSAKPYDRIYFNQENAVFRHELTFLETNLTAKTAILAEGFEAVCVFVNDTVNAEVIESLSKMGIRVIALRCAGFNNVDLKAAEENAMTVVRVPAYSPYAVAEHTVALIMALNRKTHRAYNRVREGNFSINGLLGFDLNQRTVGLIGTGRIGSIFAKIMKGFGCHILAYDPFPNKDMVKDGIPFVSLDELFADSDIISLHCPLTAGTKHIINESTISRMKDGVMLINTSRGALIDTNAVIEGLKREKIAYLGLDVYEEESELFFEDLSGTVIQDDVFARLTTFPNVLITGHQAFFTSNALQNIAETTLMNLAVLDGAQGEAFIVK